jgi:hypothetical protein
MAVQTDEVLRRRYAACQYTLRFVIYTDNLKILPVSLLAWFGTQWNEKSVLKGKER